ncbi:capsular exopolysaccharide family protein, epsB [Candidatus Magnetobacterium bavaricum]|uniref:Capsular exopolysaccharide family protein, epsB n=1 Tax=Candidatus Magnetobacterium bavaricum TaxID=29290 RepID=A0A0F3GKZ3_9BACT|nr:capsular exopolysaccharide family protein, epsB [Candidatus Magnetobacterium bavaricum]
MEFKRFLDILWRRRWLAIVVFLVFFLTVTVLTFAITPWYDSSARVMLKKTIAAASLNQSMGLSADLLQFNDTERADYLAFSTIRPIVQVVIDDLRLSHERVRYKVMKRLPFTRPIFNSFGVDVNDIRKDMTAEGLLESSLVSLIFPRPHLTVKQHEDTNVYIVTATSPDAQQAKDIANAMATAIKEAERKRILESFEEAMEVMGTITTEVKIAHLRNLRAIKEFQEKETAISIDTQVSAIIDNLAAWKKNLYNTRIAILKSNAAIRRLQQQLKWEKLDKKSEPNSLVTTEMLSHFQQRLTALALTLAETKTKYTNNHPSVIDIENQITQLKELMRKELEKVFDTDRLGMDSLYIDVRRKLVDQYIELTLNESHVAAYPDIIKKYEDELKDMSGKNYTFNVLKLDATATDSVYKTLLQYQYQIGFAQKAAMSNFTVIEPAIVHTSSKHRHPYPPLNIALALVLGSVFGIAAALMRQYMDDRVATAEDVKGLGLALIGILPHFKVKKHGIGSDLVHPFMTIVNSITYLNRNTAFFTAPGHSRPVKTIIITSALRKEGKSFIASNLAKAMSATDKKVLLIDAAGSSSSLHTYFNVPCEQGLSDYLPVVSDDMAVEDLTDTPVLAGIGGVDLLTAGSVAADNTLAINLDRFNRLIGLFEQIYDYVIVDTPAVLFADGAMLLSEAGRMVLLVIESERCQRHIIEDVLVNLNLKNLKNTHATSVVAVLNKYNVKSLYDKRYMTYRYLP